MKTTMQPPYRGLGGLYLKIERQGTLSSVIPTTRSANITTPEMGVYFNLDDDFYRGYVDREVDWGFKAENGVSLGEITFLRTYSRLKDDGSKETWPECIKRVVEGTYLEQKLYALQNYLPWSDDKAQRSAQEMFERMFTFKFLPPGRGLWMMGSDYILKRRMGAALNNCGFVSTATIDQDPVEWAMFLMDASMLGVGIGFDTLGAGKARVNKPNPDGHITLTIEDSREGWVDSLGLLLSSYFYSSVGEVSFDYSEIRAPGMALKGFGGVSAGSSPLRRMHRLLRVILGRHEGELVTSRLIVDIANIIGKCVVSGNVRRSALVSLGQANDNDFIHLKDWDRPENSWRTGRYGWSWLSNNSMVLHEDDDIDYDWLSKRVAQNGEPGVFWIDRARDYGRLVDPPTYDDADAAGSNPCMEQTLCDRELCCLVESFPIKHDSLEDYKRTLKFAYLYAKTVTLIPTHWPETNAIMKKNMRIGCSMSGLAQFVEERGWQTMKDWMNEGYDEIRDRDRQYSEWLGVRQSIKTTSIKPSGSVSLLAGVTPGVHWPVASTYIRRMKFGKDDPILRILEEAGYYVEVDRGNPDTTVVIEIPTRGPQVRSEGEVSVFEKFSLAVLAQKYYADNQVSATITFHPKDTYETTEDEVRTKYKSQVEDLTQAMKIFDGDLKSISFLGIDSGAYPQMPYEPISDGEYFHLISEIAPVDFSEVYYGGGGVEATGERYCETDKCEMRLAK